MIYGKIDEELDHTLGRKYSNVHTYWFDSHEMFGIAASSTATYGTDTSCHDTYEIQIWVSGVWNGHVIETSGIDTFGFDTSWTHILDTSFLQPCDETSFGKRIW